MDKQVYGWDNFTGWQNWKKVTGATCVLFFDVECVWEEKRTEETIQLFLQCATLLEYDLPPPYPREPGMEPSDVLVIEPVVLEWEGISEETLVPDPRTDGVDIQIYSLSGAIYPQHIANGDFKLQAEVWLGPPLGTFGETEDEGVEVNWYLKARGFRAYYRNASRVEPR